MGPENIHDVLNNIDWKLLSKQKMELYKASLGLGHDIRQLEGLVELIDAIQDAAVLEDYPVVYTEEVTE